MQPQAELSPLFANARQRNMCFQIADESGLALNEDCSKLGMK